MSITPTPINVIVDPNNPHILTLQGVRVMYASDLNAARAQAAQPGQQPGAPKFGCTVLIPNEAQHVLKASQAAMWAVAQKKWKDAAQNVWMELDASQKLALKSGATKATKPGYLGNFFLAPSANADRPPVLLDKYAAPGTTVPAELVRPQNRIYSGCHVNIQIAFWAQDNDFGKRINVEVLAVQFDGDGERFGDGGAVANTSVFGAVQAPTAGIPPAAPAFEIPGAAAPAVTAPPTAAPPTAAPVTAAVANPAVIDPAAQLAALQAQLAAAQRAAAPVAPPVDPVAAQAAQLAALQQQLAAAQAAAGVTAAPAAVAGNPPWTL